MEMADWPWNCPFSARRPTSASKLRLAPGFERILDDVGHFRLCSAVFGGLRSAKDPQRGVQLLALRARAAIRGQADGQIALAVRQVHVRATLLHQRLQQLLPDLARQVRAGAREQRAALLIQVVGLNGALGDVPGGQGLMASKGSHSEMMYIELNY